MRRQPSGCVWRRRSRLSPVGSDSRTLWTPPGPDRGSIDQVEVRSVLVDGTALDLTGEQKLFPATPRMLATGEVLTIRFADSAGGKVVTIERRGPPVWAGRHRAATTLPRTLATGQTTRSISPSRSTRTAGCDGGIDGPAGSGGIGGRGGGGGSAGGQSGAAGTGGGGGAGGIGGVGGTTGAGGIGGTAALRRGVARAGRPARAARAVPAARPVPAAHRDSGPGRDGRRGRAAGASGGGGAGDRGTRRHRRCGGAGGRRRQRLVGAGARPSPTA